MKRLHLHIKVDDIDRSVLFYKALFGCDPDKRRPDYAKWMLDDPRANISISARGGAPGVDHVGVEVDNDDALEDIAARLKSANAAISAEPDATCCYARSNKYWAKGPEGAVWELFHTFADSAIYGADPAREAKAQPAACCTPA